MFLKWNLIVLFDLVIVGIFSYNDDYLLNINCYFGVMEEGESVVVGMCCLGLMNKFC